MAISHDDVYNLNPLFEIAHKRDVICVAFEMLEWNLQDMEYDENHVPDVDLSVPIIVVDSSNMGLAVIDGHHRLVKAQALDHKFMLCHVFSEEEVELCKITDRVL